MNDDKKIELDEPTVDASEPIAESDPVIDEMVVIGLQQEIVQLRAENIRLQYEAGGNADMARMHCASGFFAAIVNPVDYCTLNGDEKREEAITQADKLISHYQDIIEKNAAEYQRRIADMEPPEDEPVN